MRVMICVAACYINRWSLIERLCRRRGLNRSGVETACDRCGMAKAQRGFECSWLASSWIQPLASPKSFVICPLIGPRLRQPMRIP